MNSSALSRVFLPRVLSSLVLFSWALVCALPANLSAQSVNFADVETVLGSGFSGPAGVGLDSSGNVFVADYNANTVSEITAASGYSTVVPLGGAFPFSHPYSVAVDASGNVFVADYGSGTVKEILAPSYTAVSTLGSTGLVNPSGVALDSTGNVFVSDPTAGKVWEIAAPAYTVVTSLGSGWANPYGIAVDGSGNLFVADFGANAVYEVLAPAYTVKTPLGAGFSQPVGVAVDGNENVYVGDYGNDALKEITAVSGYTDVNSLDGVIGSLRDVAVDAYGDVFVADYGGGKVLEFQTVSVDFGSVNVCRGGAPLPCSRTLTFNYDVATAGTLGATKVLTYGAPGLDFTLAAGGTCTGAVPVGECTVKVTFAPLAAGLRSGAVELINSLGHVISTVYIHGRGVGPEIAFDPGIPSHVGFGWNSPSGVALGGLGDIYVADSGHHRVVEIPYGGGPAFTVGHGFVDPVAVKVDGAGNLFVADEGLSQVVEILASNGSQIMLGSGLISPAGVTVDGRGDVFISDPGAGRVVELPAGGGPQFDVGGGLSTPVGLAVDGLGDLFIADPGLGGIVKLGPGGPTLLGTGLSSPYGVAVDAAGDVYVADTGNNRVVEILASSQITLASGLNAPQGLALNRAGALFVADTNDNRVILLDRIDPPSLTFADTFVTQTSSDSPQTVGVQNIGNAPLLFPKPALGFNPSITSGFTFDPATTCPIVSHSAALPGELDPGNECDLLINFTPLVGGFIHGQAILTDNSFNFNPAHQTIQLSGHAMSLFHTHVNLSLANTFLTYPGQTNLTACVTSSFSGPPTGNVLIYDGVTLIETLNLGGDGCAYWYISPGLTAGTHHLTAAYPGQLPYAPSTSPVVTVHVNPVNVNVSVSCWNSSFAYGANYYCTVSASSNDGAPPGDITYKYDAQPLVNLPISSGTANFTIFKPNAGNHTVIINYPGAPNYAPSGPFTEHFTVDPAPVNVQVVPSSWYQSAGFPFTFTATVSSWSAGPPNHNGEVSFYDGAHLIGTVTVDHHGVASITTHLHQGTHTITGTYHGGVNYATGSGTATVTASH